MSLRSRLALPTSRFAAGLLVVLLAAGCDSNNPGGSLRDLDGEYLLEQLVFEPNAGGLEDADVGARLETGATTLEIFGGDGDATLDSRFAGQARRRTDLTATASRGRLTLTARTADDQNELADLLLPPSFSLTYDAANPDELTGSVGLQSVNLEAFDPQRYQGLTSVAGALRVRFSRL